MAANSLRGGKNVYGPHCLQSNWFEERFEPAKNQATLEKLNQLPAASAKTWTKTSEAVGEHSKEMMAKKGPPIDSDNWMNYMKTDKDDMYTTTSAKSYQHPDVLGAGGEPKASMTEKQLEEYRAMWTTGDAVRFSRD
eukprot:gb/GFBE01000441.1/.p1 GENE.gb/GFBE01000441.1/~~gb/GFBE01000441.1/.p1  ORF type:complete len:137 (+),score=41.67 gb/GFBE01000441.1/:1-411(+)